MKSIPPRRSDSAIALEAAQWFLANRDGPLPTDQARAFMRWLQASPQHVAEYLDVAAIAELAPAAAQRDPIALDELMAKCHSEDNVISLRTADAVAAADSAAAVGARRPPPVRARRKRIVWRAGIAATLALSVVGGALSWWLARAEVRSYATAHGQQGTWTLPDGSRLRLNSESTVTIHFDRSKRQAEVVHGQALFDIAPQAGRPFEVRAGSHLIEDIGTVFDVYRQAAATTVTVVEGRVQLRDMAQGAAADSAEPRLDLGAGQQARLTAAGAVSRRQIDPGNALAWTREEIVFENEPLAAVVAEFNRYSRVQIRIADEAIGAVAVSGSFSIHDEATFRAFLDSLPGVRAEPGAEGLILRRRLDRP